jgi:hypothetical protein
MREAYAWSSPIEGSDRRRFVAVLHHPPITSPVEAVRAAIVAEHRTGGTNAPDAIPAITKFAFGLIERRSAPVRHNTQATVNDDGDRPEPTQRTRVAVFVHASDRASILEHGVVEPIRIDGRGEAGRTKGEDISRCPTNIPGRSRLAVGWWRDSAA